MSSGTDTTSETDRPQGGAGHWPPPPDWQSQLPAYPGRVNPEVTKEAGQIIFQLNPMTGRRVAIAFFASWVLLLVLALLIVWALHDPSAGAERWNTSLRNTALGGSFFLGYICLLVLVFVSLHRDKCIIDERGLWIHEGGYRVAVSFSHLKAIRSVLGTTRGLSLNKTGSPWWPVKLGESGFIDIVTADGVLRVLGKWDMHHLRWLSSSLSIVLGVPQENELATPRNPYTYSDDGRTVLMAAQPGGTNRKSLIYLLLFVAVSIGVFGSWFIPSGLLTYGWQRTSGVVTYSSIGPGGRVTDDYDDIEIKYAYEVDGIQYSNDRIWYAMRTNSGWIINLAETKPLGSNIDVYYDPTKPSRAVLVQGVDPYLYGALAVSLFILIYCWRMWRNDLTAEQKRLHVLYVNADAR